MQYYGPKQREHDLRWDYTVRWNDAIRPVGYCCRFVEIDPTQIPISEAKLQEHRSTAHKHHTTGHATEQEAIECYKDYLLDHHIAHHESSDQQRKCLVCETWTTHWVSVQQLTNLTLCPEHATREEISNRLWFTEIWTS